MAHRKERVGELTDEGGQRKHTNFPHVAPLAFGRSERGAAAEDNVAARTHADGSSLQVQRFSARQAGKCKYTT